MGINRLTVVVGRTNGELVDFIEGVVSGGDGTPGPASFTTVTASGITSFPAATTVANAMTIGAGTVVHQYSDPAASTYGAGNDWVGSGSGAAMDLNAVDGAFHDAFYGGESGASNTKGYQNTFIGNRSGNKNTTGFQNTYIGQGAGYQGITVVASTALGYHALLNVLGSDNTAVGFSALAGAASSSAAGNVAVGENAGFAVTSASENCILGYQGAFSLTSGISNTLVGTRAGYGAAGVGALTTGGNNLILGFQALPSAVGISNEITLGNASISNVRIPGVGLTVSAAALAFAGTITGAGVFPSAGTNVGVGGATPGTSFVNGLFFGTTVTTAPSTLVDLVHVGGLDISAGNRALAWWQEAAPNAAVAVASTTGIFITHNGVAYRLLATTVLA